MKLADPGLRDLLAAEYVLGTLHGGARRRFEHWLEEDTALRELVTAWEDRIMPLGGVLPPVEPPAAVWQEIETRIAPPQRKRANLWYCVEFWRPFGIATFVVAVALLVYIGFFAPRPQGVAYLAVLADNNAHPALVVSAAPARNELTVQAVGVHAPETGKSLELWLMPGSKQPPQPLGLVAGNGSRTLSVPASLRQMLTGEVTLAVSLEPAGGSPTGLPTGPILYRGKWLTRG
jgi:anti-sigma-K factor RskA